MPKQVAAAAVIYAKGIHFGSADSTMRSPVLQSLKRMLGMSNDTPLQHAGFNRMVPDAMKQETRHGGGFHGVYLDGVGRLETLYWCQKRQRISLLGY